MRAKRAERIRAWHERAYRSLRARDAPTEETYFGRSITVTPEVFPPVSDMLGQAVLDHVRTRDRVLDMGTGSGAQAILAASRSREVLGVDINPAAVACARANAAANGVADRTRFRVSDIFEEVDGSFDLIVFDPPFRWYRPRTMLEAAIADEGYGALGRFMAGARGHLRDDGRILLFFGTSGDIDHLYALIDRFGLDRATLAEQQLTRDGWTVTYFTYLLTAT